MPTPPVPPAIAAAIQVQSLDGALAATLEHFDCQAGTIHILPADATDNLLLLAAHRGLPPPIVTIVKSVPIGKGIAGLAAERREPITICNLQTDTSGHARPAARTTGMEGSLAVPILDPEGKLRGVLGIAKATAYDWSDVETKELLAIGTALSTVAASAEMVPE